MKVLQMTQQELSAYLLTAAEENPMIDLDAFHSHVSFDKLTWLNGFREKTPYHASKDDETVRNAENLMPDQRERGLKQALLSQIVGLGLSPEEERLCRYLIECVDDSGYMDIAPEDLAGELGIGLCNAEKCISVMRSLEPSGICARNARECLKYQARQHEDDLAVTIIEDHLEAAAKGHYAKIAKDLHFPLPEVRRAVERIRRLDPVPGRGFGSGAETTYVQADAAIRREGDRLEAELLHSYAPCLKINSSYFELLSASDDAEVKEYLNRKLYSADRLIQNVSQREETVLRCVQAIAELQRPFFLEKGSLRPMTEDMIAEKLGVDRSTVSRAIRGKYLQCDRGIVAIKALFTSQMENDAGQEFSADQAKSALLELVRAEDKRSPYSDRELCDLLRASGFHLSRRVIVKYREQLGIPSTYLRAKAAPEEETTQH